MNYGFAKPYVYATWTWAKVASAADCRGGELMPWAEAVSIRSNGYDGDPTKATHVHQAPDPRRFLQRRYLARGLYG